MYPAQRSSMRYRAIGAHILASLRRTSQSSYEVLRYIFGLDVRLTRVKAEVSECSPIGAHTLRGSACSDSPGTPAERTPPYLSESDLPSVYPSQSHLLLSVSNSPEAERRQLTVLFCDVVDSTTLAGQLDPEDLREIIRAFQAVCAEAIQRFEGSIAQYLGDGLLAYFSYPQAHEDDPQRAVHAALAILQALPRLNEELGSGYHVSLSVRIAIHTGLVVVGQIGTKERYEHLALGDTPNIAARLQSVAEPDTVVISSVTFQMIRHAFETVDLGLLSLKGVAMPMHLHRVLGARNTAGPYDAACSRGVSPLMGREAEISFLMTRWKEVREGAGRVVILTGDAGIGKSRLVLTLKDAIALEPHILLECWASAYHQATPLYPIVEMLKRSIQLDATASAAEQLGILETRLSSHHFNLAEFAPLLADFLSVPFPEGRYPPSVASPTLRRRQVLEAVLTLLLSSSSAREPILFVVEDVDRLDSSTVEFLSLLIDQASTVPVYVLLTCRSAFQVPWRGSSLSVMTLERLPHKHTDGLIGWLTRGKSLPAPIMSTLRDKSDGVPLFIEEMTRSILESGLLEETGDRYIAAGALGPFSIPPTIRDSLTSRLDRLGSSKEIAQWGSVIGRQFSGDLLRALLPYDVTTFERKLAPLLQSEVLYRQGPPRQALYSFKHSLIHDAAYESLPKHARQKYHNHVALTIESLYPDSLNAHATDIAYHLDCAGPAAEPAKVAQYGRLAGDRARAVFAWNEAAVFYRAASAAGGRGECLTDRQRAGLLYLAGQAAYEEGDTEGCITDLDEAIRLYRLTDDKRGLAEVLAKRIYLDIVGSYGEPVDVTPLDKALEVLAESDSRLVADLLIAMSEAYWTARRPQEAEAVARRALAIGARLNDHELSARASFDVALAQSQSLRLGEALTSYDEMRQHARLAGSTWYEGWALQRMPNLLYQLGRFTEAQQIAGEARGSAARTSNWGHYSLTAGTLTCLAVARGDFAAALRYCRETMDLVSQYRFPFGGASALLALACGYTLLGEALEAERALDQLMVPRRVFENPEPSYGAITRIYRELIKARVGASSNVATISVSHALDDLGADRFDVTSVGPFCALTELSARDYKPEVVSYLYERLLSASREGITFSRGWVFLLQRVLGVAATLNQRWQAAEKHFQDAINTAVAVGADPELGLTWVDYAAMLKKRDAKGDLEHAADNLRRAGVMFNRLRMATLMTQAAGTARATCAGTILGGVGLSESGR